MGHVHRNDRFCWNNLHHGTRSYTWQLYLVSLVSLSVRHLLYHNSHLNHISIYSKCDLWSLGVMAYMLLSSQIPFCGDDAKSITRKIMWGTYSFSGIRWSKISKQGRDFVSSLLIRDASSRPTADQALKHRWLDGGKPSFNSMSLHRRHSSETVGGTVLGSLKIPHRKPLDSQICSSIENYSNYSWMVRLPRNGVSDWLS